MTETQAAIAPKWMRTEISAGLKRFVALALPGQPPAETIRLTAEAWCEALMETNKQWEEEHDAMRLRKGFRALLPHLDRWPQPKHLLEAMPPRPAPKALPPAQMTEEQRKQSVSWIQKYKQTLVNKMGMTQEADS